MYTYARNLKSLVKQRSTIHFIWIVFHRRKCKTMSAIPCYGNVLMYASCYSMLRMYKLVVKKTQNGSKLRVTWKSS